MAVAMLISNAFALAAFVGLALLAAHEYGLEAAPPALRALAAYPLAFFLVAAYADTVSLAFIVFCLLCARRGAWFGAAACAFLASLTRPTGVILILPMLWEFGRQHGWWARATWRQAMAATARDGRALAALLAIALAVPEALGLYAAFCWLRFGDPLSFLHAQSWYWHRTTLGPLGGLGLLLDTAWRNPWFFLQARTLIDVAPVLLVAALTLASVRRLPVAFTLYMLGMLALEISAPIVYPGVGILPFVSVGRHMLLAVPIFLLLGHWAARRPWLDLLLVAAGFTLQGIFFIAFLHGNAIHVNAIP
jgi:hypothetical protein